jgi:hypothetical protein
MVPDSEVYKVASHSSSKPSVVVGIVGLRSPLLHNIRDHFYPFPGRNNIAGKTLPYAESAYVFRSGGSNRLFCIEQLFASRYSLSCGEGLLSFLRSERLTKMKIEKTDIKTRLEELNAVTNMYI